MNVLESLVRRFLVDKNRSAESSERSWRSGRDSGDNLKQLVAKAHLQAVKRSLMRHRADQNLARIGAALFECGDDKYVERAESDEIRVVDTAADRAERTRVSRYLQVAA